MFSIGCSMAGSIYGQILDLNQSGIVSINKKSAKLYSNGISALMKRKEMGKSLHVIFIRVQRGNAKLLYNSCWSKLFKH